MSNKACVRVCVRVHARVRACARVCVSTSLRRSLWNIIYARAFLFSVNSLLSPARGRLHVHGPFIQAPRHLRFARRQLLVAPSMLLDS